MQVAAVLIAGWSCAKCGLSLRVRRAQTLAATLDVAVPLAGPRAEETNARAEPGVRRHKAWLMKSKGSKVRPGPNAKIKLL